MLTVITQLNVKASALLVTGTLAVALRSVCVRAAAAAAHGKPHSAGAPGPHVVKLAAVVQRMHTDPRAAAWKEAVSRPVSGTTLAPRTWQHNFRAVWKQAATVLSLAGGNSLTVALLLPA